MGGLLTVECAICVCRNHDAERDCTAVIALEPGNVKALFRRGQARVGLDRLIDAQKGTHLCFPVLLRLDLPMVTDYNEAHRLEPANDSVKQELKKIDELLLKSKSKAKQPIVSPSVLTITDPN